MSPSTCKLKLGKSAQTNGLPAPPTNHSSVRYRARTEKPRSSTRSFALYHDTRSTPWRISISDTGIPPLQISGVLTSQSNCDRCCRRSGEGGGFTGCLPRGLHRKAGVNMCQHASWEKRICISNGTRVLEYRDHIPPSSPLSWLVILLRPIKFAIITAPHHHV